MRSIDAVYGASCRERSVSGGSGPDQKYWRWFFFFQAEDGIRDYKVTGVQTCALPISGRGHRAGQDAPAGPLGGGRADRGPSGVDGRRPGRCRGRRRAAGRRRRQRHRRGGRGERGGGGGGGDRGGGGTLKKKKKENGSG